MSKKQAGGSGIGAYRRGEVLTDIGGVQPGQLLVLDSQLYKATNLVKVTQIFPDKLYALMVDPENPAEKRQSSDEEFKVDSTNLSSGEYYIALEPSPISQAPEAAEPDTGEIADQPAEAEVTESPVNDVTDTPEDALRDKSEPEAVASKKIADNTYRKIVTTFAIISHDSAEQGDFEETGWIDEEGESMEPDSYDEGVTAVDKAVEYIVDRSGYEPSNSPYSPGTWYTNSKYNEDFQTGDIEARSYHLEGFTPEEEEEIYNKITGKTAAKNADLLTNVPAPSRAKDRPSRMRRNPTPGPVIDEDVEVEELVAASKTAAYESLNDAAIGTGIEGLAQGPTKIWYMNPESTRNFGMGSDWIAGQADNPEIPALPTADTIEDTHILLGEIAETDPETIFALMQGEVWSPSGDANSFITEKGLAHTSMSVGDVIEVNNELQMVDSAGFKKISVNGLLLKDWVEQNRHNTKLLALYQDYTDEVAAMGEILAPFEEWAAAYYQEMDMGGKAYAMSTKKMAVDEPENIPEDIPQEIWGEMPEESPESSEIKYEDMLPILQEKLEAGFEPISTEYETVEPKSEEVDHETVSGFIPFTDGGWQVSDYTMWDYLVGSGKSLPTQKSQKELEDMDDQADRESKDWFIKEYPEIVAEIGEDNIDYNTLTEKGYESEAEALDEARREWMSESVDFRLAAYYYTPDNTHNESPGKHSLYLFYTVNMESPYHRTKYDDTVVEQDITFNTLEEMSTGIDQFLAKVQGGATETSTEASTEKTSMEPAHNRKPHQQKIWSDKTAASNQDVIDMFITDSFPKDKMPTWGTANLTISKKISGYDDIGWALINYLTPIMFRNNNGEVFFNTQKYSMTTTQIQNKIKAALQANGVSATEVDESGMSAAIDNAIDTTQHVEASKKQAADDTVVEDLYRMFEGTTIRGVNLQGGTDDIELSEEPIPVGIVYNISGLNPDSMVVFDQGGHSEDAALQGAWEDLEEYTEKRLTEEERAELEKDAAELDMGASEFLTDGWDGKAFTVTGKQLQEAISKIENQYNKKEFDKITFVEPEVEDTTASKKTAVDVQGEPAGGGFTPDVINSPPDANPETEDEPTHTTFSRYTEEPEFKEYDEFQKESAYIEVRLVDGAFELIAYDGEEQGMADAVVEDYPEYDAYRIQGSKTWNLRAELDSLESFDETPQENQNDSILPGSMATTGADLLVNIETIKASMPGGGGDDGSAYDLLDGETPFEQGKLDGSEAALVVAEYLNGKATSFASFEDFMGFIGDAYGVPGETQADFEQGWDAEDQNALVTAVKKHATRNDFVN